MSESVSDSEVSPSTPRPTSSYHLSSKRSSGSRKKTIAKRAARAAAVAAVPEIAVPLELIGRSMRSSAPSPLPSSRPVIVIPPEEKDHLISWGKERVRIVTKKGITFVHVERPKHLGIREALEALIVLGVAGKTYDNYRHGATFSGGFVITEGSTFGIKHPILNLPYGWHIPLP